MGTPANHYELAGEGIEGTIDIAGLTGEPVISLRVDGAALDDPQLTDTGRGFAVTAIVDVVGDLRTVAIEVVLPHVNIDGDPLPYSGIAILTSSRTSIGGPGLVDGVIEAYDLRCFDGVAASVEF